MSASQVSWIFSVSTDDFQKRVVEKSHDVPVVVDFWAPWCGPCRALTPILERLINERNGEVLLAKVNIDDEQKLAAEFRIEGVPAVIAFRGGRPVVDFVGVYPETEIRRFLDSVVFTEAERDARKAKDLEKTDAALAEKMYRDALALDRNQENAILGLARLLMARNQNDEAGELLENLGPGSAHADEVQRLGAQLMLTKLLRDVPEEMALQAQVKADAKNALARYQLGVRLAAAGLYQESLDLLLAAGDTDTKLASTKVREAMVQVFHLVGDQSSLANEYRNKLSLLLY